MSRVRVLAGCVASAVAGAAGGAAVAVWMMADIASAVSLQRADMDLRNLAMISRELAAGRMERARSLLETRIDGALVEVAARGAGVPRSASAQWALERIRLQRGASGYVPGNAEVAKVVAAALAPAPPATDGSREVR